MTQEQGNMSPGLRNNKIADERERLVRKKKYLRLRAEMIQAIRSYFIEQGYLEVETPQIINEVPPEVHIDPITIGKKFLITSPELCMKRLLSAGYKNIFQITKCFRDGERGSLHLPEFTMLEWYRTGIDYRALMEESEALLLAVLKGLGMEKSIRYRGKDFDFQVPWKRMTVEEAFGRYSSLGPDEAIREGKFDQIMVEKIEPNLGIDGPEFIYDYPESLAALSRLKPGNEQVSERFELYVAGIELANGFSELNNSLEQRERFTREQGLRRGMDKPVYPLPNRFLASLENMPESAGIAFGLDRLAMIFTDRPVIDDVVTFTPEDL